MHSCDFTFRHYRELLRLFSRKGYQSCFFQERRKKKKIVYLRHDIDLDIENALALALLEKKEGLFATYFVRMQAPFYNALAPDSITILREIRSLGHRIGLHFDQNFSNTPMLSGIKKELAILGKYVKADPIVSFHQPSKSIFGKNFPRIVSTYERRFFSRVPYLSDSKGTWRDGCPKAWFLKNEEPDAIQVLTHPIWWSKEGKNDINGYIAAWHDKQREKTELQLKKNISSYQL